LNLPNILSTFRIILIPLIAYCFSLDKFNIALILFILACVTDILDGYIARKYNLITDLGKILDPLADKGMQITVLASMAVYDLMPWLVVIVMLIKELMMFLGGIFLYRNKVVVGANWYGKVATVVTSLCVVAILALRDYLDYKTLVVLQWLPVAVALFAFLRYLIVYIKIKPERRG